MWPLVSFVVGAFAGGAAVARHASSPNPVRDSFGAEFPTFKEALEATKAAWDPSRLAETDEEAEESGYDLTGPSDLARLVEDAMWELTHVLRSADDDGRIDVYRSITLPRGRTFRSVRLDPVGVFWAWDEAAAEPHWSKGQVEYLLHGKVAVTDVDWTASVAALPANGGEEKEIRIRDGAEVHLVGYRVAPTYPRHLSRGPWKPVDKKAIA